MNLFLSPQLLGLITAQILKHFPHHLNQVRHPTGHFLWNWFSLLLLLGKSRSNQRQFCCYEGADAEMFSSLGKLKTATTTLALLTGSQWSHFTALFVFGKVISLKIYWQSTKSSTWTPPSPARNIDMLPWLVSYCWLKSFYKKCDLLNWCWCFWLYRKLIA